MLLCCDSVLQDFDASARTLLNNPLMASGSGAQVVECESGRCPTEAPVLRAGHPGGPVPCCQRLRDEAGLAVWPTSFRRYVWSVFPDTVDASKVTVLRPEVPAREDAQID